MCIGWSRLLLSSKADPDERSNFDQILIYANDASHCNTDHIKRVDSNRVSMERLSYNCMKNTYGVREKLAAVFWIDMKLFNTLSFYLEKIASVINDVPKFPFTTALRVDREIMKTDVIFKIHKFVLFSHIKNMCQTSKSKN